MEPSTAAPTITHAAPKIASLRAGCAVGNEDMFMFISKY
jgi:hypothetical protein